MTTDLEPDGSDDSGGWGGIGYALLLLLGCVGCAAVEWTLLHLLMQKGPDWLIVLVFVLGFVATLLIRLAGL